VTVSGSAPINPVRLTGIGGFNVFTSGGFVFLQGGGATSGDYVTRAETGQFAAYTALYQSGQLLISLISASSAGVASLNGGSGVLNLVGAGNMTVTRVGQTLFVSGDTGAYANFASLLDLAATGAKITALSGFATGLNAATSGVLAGQIAQSGAAAVAVANANALNLSGNLAASGATLGALIVATGNAAVTHANGIGSGLTGYVNAVSGALQAQITAGGGTQLSVTGSSVLPSANLSGQGGLIIYTVGGTVFFSGGAGAGTVTQAQFDALSGSLGLSGSNLYRLVTGASGQLTTDLASKTQLTQSGAALGAQITALSGYTNGVSGVLQGQINLLPTAAQLAQTGTTLYALTTGLSGVVNTSLVATGNSAVIHANGIGSGLSGNLAATGTALYAQNTGLSGYLIGLISASSAGVAALNGASGVVTINGTGGISVFTNGQIITVSGSVDPSVYATISYVTGVSGALNSSIIATGNAAVTFAAGGLNIVSGNATQSGIQLLARDLLVSGWLTTGLAQTGSAAVTHSNGNAVNLSGALTNSGVALLARDLYISGLLSTGIAQTGSTLNTQTLGLSGYLISLISAASAGVSAINGQSGVLTLQGTGGIVVITQGQSLFVSGNLDPANFPTTALVTGMSGALVSQIIATGNSAVAHANGVGGSLSGALTTTGQTLLAIITGLSGDTSSAFLRNVNATGFATNMITGLSGLQYVLYPFSFPRSPYVQVTAEYGAFNAGLYGLGTSGISTSGVYVLYSDSVLETGNRLHFWLSI